MCFYLPPRKKHECWPSGLYPANIIPLQQTCLHKLQKNDSSPTTTTENASTTEGNSKHPPMHKVLNKQFAVLVFRCSWCCVSPCLLGTESTFYHKKHLGIIRTTFSLAACQLVLLSLTSPGENAEIGANNNSNNVCRPLHLDICSLAAPFRLALQQRINNMTSESHLLG